MLDALFGPRQPSWDIDPRNYDHFIDEDPVTNDEINALVGQFVELQPEPNSPQPSDLETGGAWSPVIGAVAVIALASAAPFYRETALQIIRSL